jgi:hypothetical protein
MGHIDRQSAPVSASGRCQRPASFEAFQASWRAVFSSYPAKLIATWCRVSLSTAYAYRRGDKQPSLGVLALFFLHVDGRVLEADVWDGWYVYGAYLVGPSGAVLRCPQRPIAVTCRSAQRKAQRGAL